MKIRSLILLLLCLLTFPSFSQTGERITPLGGNIELQYIPQRAYPGIYLYEVDTLSLPFVDDFSKNKFRKYDAQPGDPNVTETLYYMLHQDGSPLPPGTGFSLDSTLHIEVDTLADGTDTIYYSALPVDTIILYDLTQYPIVGDTEFVYPCYNVIDTIYLGTSDTIYAPCDITQDSVYVYNVSSNDTLSAVWIDKFAYHNYRYGYNPPTLGVATFDGFDENGFPYDFSLPGASGIADYLTSKPIDLSGNTAGDSIYLSFYYQPGGIGDEVPESGDSLVLEFYNTTTSDWEHIWSVPGSARHEFKQVMIPILKPAYFSNAFQMRFKNYGLISGNVDPWQLEYVYMNQFRYMQDTIRDDVAFRYQGSTLLNNGYISMPLTHFAGNPTAFMRDTVSVFQRNNNISPRLVGNQHMKVFHEGVELYDISNGTPSITGFTDFKTVYGVADSSVVYDTSLIDSCAEVFDLQFVHNAGGTEFNRDNDTMRFSQIFSNYYAYDDGTAEDAYGPIGTLSQVAYQFTLAQPDDMYGIAIHFSPTVNDVDDKTFFLTIWDNSGSGGSPGSIIYQETILSDVVYGNTHNKFYVYPFSSNISVSGTIYIGWEQVELEPLNVGFDRNNNNQSKIYYNTGSGWNNTSFAGSLLMRPVFAICDTNVVSVAEHSIEEEQQVTIYPNPAHDQFSVKSDELVEGIQIFDVAGKSMGTFSQTTTVSIGHLSKGIYLVNVVTAKGQSNHRLVVD